MLFRSGSEREVLRAGAASGTAGLGLVSGDLSPVSMSNILLLDQLSYAVPSYCQILGILRVDHDCGFPFYLSQLDGAPESTIETLVSIVAKNEV